MATRRSDEHDLVLPAGADAEAVHEVVERAARRVGLHISHVGGYSRRKYPESVHWHLKRGKREAGVLDLTFWDVGERFWLTVRHREPEWVHSIVPDLVDALAVESGRVPADAAYALAMPVPAERIVTKIIFPVSDMAAAVRFYEVIGFVVEAFDDAYAWVRHRGEEILHLALVPDLDPTLNAAAGYFHVQDPDAWHQACSAAVVAGELADCPWGMREFELRDPSGNLLRVGANI